MSAYIVAEIVSWIVGILFVLLVVVCWIVGRRSDGENELWGGDR